MKRFTPVRINAFLLILMLVAAVIAMIMLRQCSVEGPFAAINHTHSKGDTIDVAIEYSPVSIYRQGDTLGGFAYDLLRKISGDSMILKFHPVASAAAAVDGLHQGVYDLIVADLPTIAGTDTTIAYTENVYLDRQVLVQRRDSVSGDIAVKSSLDLAGQTITIPKGSPVKVRLSNLSREIGDSIFISEDPLYGPEQLFIMVATGDIEFTVVNERLAAIMASDYPSVDISANISLTQFQSWILRSRDSLLRARIDSAIIRVRRSSL